jgi:hypothetical protein
VVFAKGNKEDAVQKLMRFAIELSCGQVKRGWLSSEDGDQFLLDCFIQRIEAFGEVAPG